MVSLKIEVVTPERPCFCLILLYVDFLLVNYKEHGQAEEWKEDIKVVGFFFFIIWGLNLEQSGRIESGEKSGDKSG